MLRRLVVAGVVVAVALAATLAPAPGRPAAATERAAACTTPEGEVAVGQVLVVVAFPSGTVSICVPPGGTGIDVLRSAGFDVVPNNFGSVGGAAAVCAIGPPGGGEQVGCATGPRCLTCGGPDYWQYYRCWAYSAAGGGSTRPEGGTIEAWRWGRSSSWPAGDRPAACDSDDDDVVDVVVPPPPPPPPSSSSPGRPDPTRPSTGGGSVVPGPGSGSVPDRVSPGGQPGDGGRGQDDLDDPTSVGGDPTDPAAPGSTDGPGSAPGDRADAAVDEDEEAGEGGVAPDSGGDRSDAAPPPGSGPGSQGGGGWGALAGTVAVVGALALAVAAVRRRRAAGTAVADGSAPG